MGDQLSPEFESRRRQEKHRRPRGSGGWRQSAALVVFALMVTAGPLAFGAVDRFVQVLLTVLLGVGMVLQPARLGAVSGRMKWVWIGLAVLAVGKELAPAGLFGAVSWRKTLTTDYGVVLPWTHHPELGRAVDAWLAGLLAFGWLAWVRTLAGDREERTRLAWILLLSGVIVGAVSFATADMQPNMIYGVRYTPGWLGFGPFPNRNHTASYFALVALIGLGCIARAGERRRYVMLGVAIVLEAFLCVALLRTHSRGGFIAFGAGLVLFFAAVVLKLRTRQSIAVATSCLILTGGLALVAGGGTVQRLASTGKAKDESASTRVAVWRNAGTMWKDAPFFGHGAGAFIPVFPMYQNISMEEVTVKHPESSLLQWLVESGLVLVVAAGALLIPWVGRRFFALFEDETRGFFIRTAGFAAVTAILVHCIYDVPAHRWGTAGLGLAALALACPAVPEVMRRRRWLSAAPFAIAAFWMLPVWIEAPRWAPFQLDRLLATEAMAPTLSLREIDAELRCFPLSPALHRLRGDRLFRAGQPAATWLAEFRIATRLVPNSWQSCVWIARLCRERSPAAALHYWQMAVERATRQRTEVFSSAITETQDLPGAANLWRGYVEAQPDLALLFSEGVEEAEGRQLFQMWWDRRGSQSQEVTSAEADAYMRVALRWSTPDQLLTWIRLHPEREAEDFRKWAAALHGWKEDEKAWGLLRRTMKEPDFPSTQVRLSREALDFRWRHNPDDIVNARAYAQVLNSRGESDASEAVVAEVAQRADAPKWFLEKAAFQFARQRRFPEAVASALRAAAAPAKPAQ